MKFDELKQVATFLLKNYELAWQRNAAMVTLLENYPMPDGTKGIPQWRTTLESWLSDPAGKALAHERFAPLFRRLAAAERESTIRELLDSIPRPDEIQ